MATLAQDGAPRSITRLGRAGWLLIGSFVAGLLLILVQVVFYADLDTELVARAVELGRRPPLEEYSQIQARYAGPFLLELVRTLLLGLPPFALLAAATVSLRQSLQAFRQPRLTDFAQWCALGALVAWLAQLYLDLSIKFGPERWLPGAARFDLLYSPLAFATAWFGLAAVICAALALRHLGIAPRVAVAAVAVAVLLAVGNLVLAIISGFTVGLPPLVPLIPALMLGGGLVRARPPC